MGSESSKQKVQKQKLGDTHMLSEEEAGQYMRAFKKNTSGKKNDRKMTQQDLEEMFLNEKNTEALCKVLFLLLDLNNDQSISLEEFMFGVIANSAVPNKLKLRFAFEILDINGDGTVDLTEMKKIVEEFQCSHENDEEHHQRVESTFKALDKNGDHVISWEEFQKSARKDAMWLLDALQVGDAGSRTSQEDEDTTTA